MAALAKCIMAPCIDGGLSFMTSVKDESYVLLEMRGIGSARFTMLMRRCEARLMLMHHRHLCDLAHGISRCFSVTLKSLTGQNDDEQTNAESTPSSK